MNDFEMILSTFQINSVSHANMHTRFTDLIKHSNKNISKYIESYVYDK